ncbi:MAG TPA: hypothetical protein VN836_09940 [Verrucomicrobiae bacterium]|nr:hypothetical protein [Verrucomicrobiae bacterium]
MMPQKIASGNEKLAVNSGNQPATGRRTFCLASSCALRNNYRVKTKILLFVAAITSLILTGGCVSIG